jgi:hypothetical protein
LASRITSAHFSVSAAINLSKSAGDPSIMPPRSANFFRIAGSAIRSSATDAGGGAVGSRDAMPALVLKIA